MSTGTTSSSITPPQSGFRAALRYTGIPESWIKRPKLPSRNWLIFITLTSSVVGLYAYDRRKCKEIRQAYIDRVKHLAEAPLQSWDLPRKVTVYGSRWPGDEDYNRSIKYFRKYVKPILVAAAIDYDIVNGKRHGDLASFIAEQIKSRRRRELGLDPQSASIIPLSGKISPEEKRQRELQGGSIIIGRQTFKEYMEGLKRGWTESLERVDREEVLSRELADDGHFDEPEIEDPSAGIDGEPIPTKSRLMPSNNTPIFSPLRLDTSPKRTEKPNSFDSSLDVPPQSIPPVPPLLLVAFTNRIGLTQIPLMIYDFFNQRAKVQSGAEAAYRLVSGNYRAISAPPPSELLLETESSRSSSLERPQTDLDFDRQAESHYKSSLKSTLEDIEKARSEYYRSLPAKLETARSLSRGHREPTKDEQAYPPPSEVELRAERMKKELRWRDDVDGWNIVRPDAEVPWDERFRDSLKLFVDPPDE